MALLKSLFTGLAALFAAALVAAAILIGFSVKASSSTAGIGALAGGIPGFAVPPLLISLLLAFSAGFYFQYRKHRS